MNKRKILIVEDEAVTSVMLEKTLKDLGYEVVGSAFDGTEAIDLAKDKRPDLILMDIRIQGDMDGIETAKRIYQQYNIPIIYLTAHSDDDTIKRAVESGPFGYLIKPFKERELYSNIEMVIHKNKLYRTTTTQRPSEEKEKQEEPLAKPVQTTPKPVDIRMGILAVQALPHPVILFNASGTVVYNNPAMRGFIKAIAGHESSLATIEDLPEIFRKLWTNGRERFKEGKPFSITGPIMIRGAQKRYRFDMIPLLEKGNLQFITSSVLPEGPVESCAMPKGNLLDEVIMDVKEIGFLASTQETYRMHKISIRAGESVRILEQLRNISYPEGGKEKNQGQMVIG